MVHPAARAVVFPRDGRALVGQLPDHPEQRLGTLGEVGHLGRPVVHLRVDVGRVLRIPHGIHVLVPDPLQVGRLRARTRRGDQHIAPELEQQRREGRVVGAVEFLQPFVGGKRGVGRRAEVDAHAPEEALVLGGVRRLEILRMSSADAARSAAFDARIRIAAHILVVHEAGRRGDKERDAAGLADDEAVILDADAAPVGEGAKPNRVPEPPGDAEVVRRLAADDEAVGAVDVHPEVVGGVVGVGLVPIAAQLCRERQAPRGLGRQPHHNHLIDGRTEDLAAVSRAVALVRRRRHRRVEIELVAVAGLGAARRERQHEVAE